MRRDVVAQRQLEADEVLEHRGDLRAPGVELEDRRRSTPSISIEPDVGVVQPAQQLGERRLAGAVLADDRHRRAGRDRQVEAVEHRTATVG